MSSHPGKSKQSDGCHLTGPYVLSSTVCGKLCVMGGFCYIYTGAAPYTNFTDWI